MKSANDGFDYFASSRMDYPVGECVGSIRLHLLTIGNSLPTRRRLPKSQNSNILLVNDIITNWAKYFISDILFGLPLRTGRSF